MSESYTVRVGREDGWFTAQADDPPGAITCQRTLRKLDQGIREAIAGVEALPRGAEAGLDIHWDYSGLGVDYEMAAALAALAARRAANDAERRGIVADTDRAVRALRSLDWSVRDIAAVTGVSPALIGQVASRQAQSQPRP